MTDMSDQPHDEPREDFEPQPRDYEPPRAEDVSADDREATMPGPAVS